MVCFSLWAAYLFSCGDVIKMTKEICECGYHESWHPVPPNDFNKEGCKKFKPKNQSRFQNHINVIKCATRLRDIDSTRHGSDDESLSSNIVKEEWVSDGDHHVYADFVYTKDVKEFIKDLKEEIAYQNNKTDIDKLVVTCIIDKRAGKGLI